MSNLHETFREASLGCSLTSEIITRCIRNLKILQESRKRPRGRWSHRHRKFSMTVPCIQDRTSGSRSILHLSSKYLPGVFEDMEVPDTPGDGFRWKRISQKTFPESFMKIEPQETGQDSTCPLNLFLKSWRTWRFLMHLVMVSDGRGNPREASLKVS